MLKELSEDLSGPQQHKKDPVRNKGYTNWNKEQFTGKQQKMDEDENQINDLEHKEEKNNQSEQQEEKRIQKVMRVV